MAQPYVGEIRMFAGTFNPAGWMFCEGQTMPIAENETLFQLIGTTYGGDGQDTFRLPDLRGRLPIHFAPGYVQGQSGGTESVTLTALQMPFHSHALNASSGSAQSSSPQGSVLAEAEFSLYGDPGPVAPLALAAVSTEGGSQPHTNLMPYVCVNFIISLFGIFPSQT